MNKLNDLESHSIEIINKYKRYKFIRYLYKISPVILILIITIFTFSANIYLYVNSIIDKTLALINNKTEIEVATDEVDNYFASRPTHSVFNYIDYSSKNKIISNKKESNKPKISENEIMVKEILYMIAKIPYTCAVLEKNENKNKSNKFYIIYKNHLCHKRLLHEITKYNIKANP